MTKKNYTTLEHVQYGVVSCVGLALCVAGLCWAVTTLVEYVAQALH